MSITVLPSAAPLPDAEPKKIAVRAFVPPPPKMENANANGAKRPERGTSKLGPAL